MDGLFINEIRIDWNVIDSESYIRGIDTLSRLDRLEFDSPITIFAGENGSGKSTLLEAMAVASGFNPEGGTKNYRFSTFDSHSELEAAMTVVRGHRRERSGYFLRAESFYNVATKEVEYADLARLESVRSVPERLHERSHGESFLATAQRHLRPDGLYFLDEPEAALSPQMQLTLLSEIYGCARKGAQFFIVTHSPILSGLPDATILSFDGGEIHRCTYEETSSYHITKLFINNRNQLLRQLLDEQNPVDK